MNLTWIKLKAVNVYQRDFTRSHTTAKRVADALGLELMPKYPYKRYQDRAGSVVIVFNTAYSYYQLSVTTRDHCAVVDKQITDILLAAGES